MKMTVGREKDSRGRPIWRVRYSVARRRIRKTFHSKEEADAWIACNTEIAVEEARPEMRLEDLLAPLRKHASRPRKT